MILPVAFLVRDFLFALAGRLRFLFCIRLDVVGRHGAHKDRLPSFLALGRNRWRAAFLEPQPHSGRQLQPRFNFDLPVSNEAMRETPSGDELWLAPLPLGRAAGMSVVIVGAGPVTS